MRMSTKVLLLVLGLISMAQICQAATTVTDCGDGNKVVTMTATGDTLSSAYNLAGYRINAVRVEVVDGAKTFRIRKGTAASGTVLWRGYSTGASSGTTATLESNPSLALARGNGLYWDTSSATCTLELYIGPK